MTVLARIESNKQLLPVELVAPGRLGINTEQAGSILPGEYATDALNCVIDTNSRLAARFGTTTVTSTPIPAATGVITAITQAANAVITVNTVSAHNPYYIGQSILVTGVSGMTQINGLTGTVTAVGGASGAWTATVSINSTSFSAYTSGGQLAGPYPIQSVFEYNGGATVGFQIILAWYGAISNSVTNPNGSLITGTAPFTSGRWFFQNFNNKCIGFQNGQTPIVYTGSGNFASIVASSGSVPIGGIGCCAFGRVWTVDADLQTIHYSGLLDETNWGTSDAGVVDMHSIWSNGTDTVQAICAFNSSLIVFGLNHIVFFTDGRGSLLGIDPTQMYVYDIISGTGCISQFTTKQIAQSDLLFLSPIGIQSLTRLIQNNNNPLATPSKYIRSVLTAMIAQEVANNISCTYDSLQGFFLISLPVSQVVWCFDLRQPYHDQIADVCYRITYWDMLATSLMTTHNNTTYIARTSGQVATYSGFQDEGSTYNYNWQSPWLQLDPQISERLKMLKRLEAILIASGGQTVIFGHNVDFLAVQQTEPITLSLAGGGGQYGIGQYGISQYGGGSSPAIVKVDVRNRGQYYQLSLNSPVNGAFALQQIQAAFKIGRIA